MSKESNHGRLRAVARGLVDTNKAALREIQSLPGCQALAHAMRREIERAHEILGNPRRRPARLHADKHGEVCA